MYTKNCIYCFKPAVYWTGHVLTESLKKSDSILAGWCEKHGGENKPPAGFFGHHKEEMGKTNKPHSVT